MIHVGKYTIIPSKNVWVRIPRTVYMNIQWNVICQGCPKRWNRWNAGSPGEFGPTAWWTGAVTVENGDDGDVNISEKTSLS